MTIYIYIYIYIYIKKQLLGSIEGLVGLKILNSKCITIAMAIWFKPLPYAVGNDHMWSFLYEKDPTMVKNQDSMGPNVPWHVNQLCICLPLRNTN